MAAEADDVSPWRMRRSIASFVVLCLLILLVACASARAAPPPFDDVDVAGRSVNPDGLAYPADDWGARPRSGTRPGQRIPNFSFQGYPDSKREEGLRVVSFADFYDPEQVRYKLMYLVAVVGWCPHCQAETRRIVASTDTLRADGVVIVQTMMEGADPDRPLSLVDVDGWVDAMGTRFTVLIDVEAKRLGTVADIKGVPWNAMIDTRSMEVLDVTEGELDDVLSYVAGGLGWVSTHDARP